MASQGNDETLASAQVEDAKTWCSATGGDDLFSHAHQTLLKDELHQEGEERKDKSSAGEKGVKERKRKRRKERIRHIQRVEGNSDVSLHPSHPLLVSLASLTPKAERLSPQPATGPPSGVKRATSRPTPRLPPLIPLSLKPSLSPSASPSPHPYTPPLTRSLPPSPTPTQMSPPFVHSPSPTRQPSPPISITPTASPPDARSCLIPTIEETEMEIRKKKVCGVCGDVACSLHFGARVCDSCKAFFRRAVMFNTFPAFACVRRSQGGDGGGDGEDLCVITVKNRKECQFCRFSACLKVGMEVSFVSREEERSRGLACTLGLYRHRSRHAHAKTLHGAPYLPGCWGQCSTPVLTPRLKEDSTRHSPTGGEAAQHVASVPVAAPPPLPTPLVQGYSYLGRQGPNKHTQSPSDHPRAAPELGHAFSPDPSLSHDLSLTFRQEPVITHTHNPAASPRRLSPLTRLPLAATHRTFRHTQSQGHASATRTPAAAVPPSPSGATRVSKWPRSPPMWSAPDPSTPWRPDPPVGDMGGAGGHSAQPSAAAPRHDALTPEDLDEIKQLHESYVGSVEAVAGPLEECVPRSELGRLYTCFIERRAKFLVSTPLYGTVAAADRPRLLHVAVAMSTYFTGAHHIDTSDFSWQQRRGAGLAGREVAVLSASSVRQLLSHQQFLHVMKFYTKYCEALADHTTAILMQVMSLFYPEERLQAPRPVEDGRLHYLGLLSRYLTATLGSREGTRRLATLLTSQQEARQLVDLLQQVDLTPREPGIDLATSKDMLVDRIHLVCEAARGGKGRRGGRGSSEGVRPLTPPSGTIHEAEGGSVDRMGRILTLLAQCEDPHILARARHILPAPLLQRFLQQLLSPTPHTPPSPSPSPPSPQCHKLSLTRDAGGPPPRTVAPRVHAPELAAE